jgi:curved DNA-binding protein CbpA
VSGDHYSTLGVGKEADEGEIRKAYRSKAQKAHPDKEGGDLEQFKQLQHAYDVLSDEDRRRRYDNGEDVSKRTATIEERASSLLMQLFAQQFETTTDHLDMVLAVKTDIEVRMGELRTQKSKAQAHIRKMLHLQERVHYKGTGRDRFHDLTQQQIDHAKRAMEKMTEEDKVLNRTLLLADEYECEVTKAPPVTTTTDGWRTVTFTDA